jgi:SAM-dependent methyltransferase
LCTPDGSERYPIVRDIPVLIDESASAFSIAGFVEPQNDSPRWRRSLNRLATSIVPGISRNLAAAENYRLLAEKLNETPGARRRVLVIGGSVPGEGFESLLAAPGLELVETDVAFGPRTQVICDGHALPFADGCFDAVVCQAVLEHVADPPTVVSEIHRVLGPGGLVYSEIPFMQQVHEGAHDFTRYTLIGHRRLYRRFDCLRIGITGGPAMGLAWSIKYFAATLGGNSAAMRRIFSGVSNYFVFWLKYLDRPMRNLPAAADAASGTFFLGRRSETTVSDHTLVREFGAPEGGYLRERG